MAVYVFLFFLTFYTLLNAGIFHSSDGVTIFSVTENLVREAKLDINYFGEHWHVARDNKYYSKYGLGMSLTSIPFFLAGDIINDLANSGIAGSFFVSFHNSLVSALTCLVLYLFCLELGIAGKSSILAVFMYGICTMALPYSKYYFPDNLIGLALVFGFYALFMFKRKKVTGWLWAAGFALGFSVLTKSVVAFLIIPFLVYLVINVRDKRLTAFIMPFVFCILLSLLYNLVRYGTVFDTGYFIRSSISGIEERFDTPILRGLYGLLFSPGKSVFLYNPVLLLLPFVFARERFRKFRKELFVILAVLVLFLIVYGKWRVWSGDWAWGPRYFVEVMPLLMVPIALGLDKLMKKGRKTLLIIIIAISFLVQVPPLFVDNMRYFDSYLIPQADRTAQSGTGRTYSEGLSRNGNIPLKHNPVVIQTKMFLSMFDNTAELMRTMNKKYKNEKNFSEIFENENILGSFDFWFLYLYYSGINGYFIILLLFILTGICAYAAINIFQLLKREHK